MRKLGHKAVRVIERRNFFERKVEQFVALINHTLQEKCVQNCYLEYSQPTNEPAGRDDT